MQTIGAAYARKEVMEKYLLEVRRQAVELCIFDGITLTPENIINALSELGYIVAAEPVAQADVDYCSCNPNEALYKIGSNVCAVCERPRC